MCMTPSEVCLWVIQIGQFATNKTYFCKTDFHFFNRPHAAFPFPASREKGNPQWTPKVSDTKGCMTLGYSNWPICSQQNLFLKPQFHLINKPHAAFPFSCMLRKGQPTVDPKREWHQSFKLAHQSPQNLFLESKFPNYYKPLMQHYPFPACKEKRRMDSKVNDAKITRNRSTSLLLAARSA